MNAFPQGGPAVSWYLLRPQIVVCYVPVFLGLATEQLGAPGALH